MNAPPTGSRFERGTVLVVEDSPEIREALEGLIRDEGYGVRLACDGVEGLSALRKRPLPELVVLDLNMPRMSGFELIRRMRTHALWRTIPVLVCSALPPDAVGELPAVEYLPKPIDVDTFLAIVARHCRAREALVPA